MTKTLRHRALWAAALAGAVVLSPRDASAVWKKSGQVPSGTTLSRVSSPDGKQVVAAGFSVQPSGMFYVGKPHAFASADRGKSFTAITGTLSSATGNELPSAITFLDQSTGWFGFEKNLFRTTDAGATWTAAAVGSATNDLHFFDARNGIRVGDGGAIATTADGGSTWTPRPSGTSANLQRMFWLDAQRGWVSGYAKTFDGIATRAVVLRTSDGGQSWQASSTIDGHGAGPVFFLADGTTGWLGAFMPTGGGGEPDSDANEARLLKTTDGGATFTDAGLPLEVGKSSAFGFTSAIKTAQVHAMYWADAQRGHLAAAAYLGKSSSGSSGGMTSTNQTTTYWRIIDYVTRDGGASWTKTDLGTVQSSFNSPPPSDGTLKDAHFADLYNGWYVADSAVWVASQPCTTDAECGDGYLCRQMQCEQEETKPGPTDGGSNNGGNGNENPDDERDPSLASGGCECSSTSTLPAGALVLALAGLRHRRRRLDDSRQ